MIELSNLDLETETLVLDLDLIEKENIPGTTDASQNEWKEIKPWKWKKWIV